MKSAAPLCSLLLAWLLAESAHAQTPADADRGEASPATENTDSPKSSKTDRAEAPTASEKADATQPSKSDSTESGVEAGDRPQPAEASKTPETGSKQQRDERRASLYAQNSFSGSTGLLRLSEAGSGAPRTFRLSLITSYFSGSGFLCDGTSTGGCAQSTTPTDYRKDSASQTLAHLGLSVTPWEFLEAFVGLRAKATYNDQNPRRTLFKSFGDLNLGVKAFTPGARDRIFRFGGEAEVLFLSAAGNIGLTGDATSFRLRGIGTLDLSQRSTDPLPLKAHLNLGWLFDNSAQLVADAEAGRSKNVTRIERFGRGISRVDSLQIGVGVEGTWNVARPFLEWTIDVPESRQDYQCVRDRLDAGDGCLKSQGGFSATPSRLGLGVRVYPGLQGLGILGALEIGTGATSTFMDAVLPETPWRVYLGLGYAIDAQPPKPIVQKVTVEHERVVEAAKPVHHTIQGRVIDQTSKDGLPHAAVEYEGRSLTGMVTDADGGFRTLDLEPGEYKFKVTADGFKPGECQTTLPEKKPAKGAEVSIGKDGSITAKVECQLEALPKVGTITGTIIDAAKNTPIPEARIRIKDKFGRELELTATATGGFRFEEVPAGPVRLIYDAPNYLTGSTELELKAREDAVVGAAMNLRPKKASVTVDKNELKLTQQIQFEHGSAKILPASQALIQEIAEVLRNHKELQLVEIQGHTDDVGSAAENQRLSAARAEAVRNALIGLRVEGQRMTPKGYGLDKPLVPNSSDANRAKNRRVQFVILEKTP